MTSAEAQLDAKLARCHGALAHAVSPTLQVGCVMIQEGVLLPEHLALPSEGYAAGWRAVRTSDGFGVDRKMRAAGWNLFLIGGEVKAIVWGAAGEKKLRRAMVRILATVRSRCFNAAEVTGIANQRFLGIPYTVVRAFSRHVQQSHVLQDVRRRAQVQVDADWARA